MLLSENMRIRVVTINIVVPELLCKAKYGMKLNVIDNYFRQHRFVFHDFMRTRLWAGIERTFHSILKINLQPQKSTFQLLLKALRPAIIREKCRNKEFYNSIDHDVFTEEL